MMKIPFGLGLDCVWNLLIMAPSVRRWPRLSVLLARSEPAVTPQTRQGPWLLGYSGPRQEGGEVSQPARSIILSLPLMVFRRLAEHSRWTTTICSTAWLRDDTALAHVGSTIRRWLPSSKNAST